MLRQLKLILWKNLVIRKRHWLLTLAEILIPILLFTLVAYGRSKISGLTKVNVDHPTYYKIQSLDDIYSHLDVGELNLWYSPYSDFTENIVKRVQETFQIPGDSVKDFTSEENLLKHFNSKTNWTSLIVAINFHGTDTKHLNYDLSFYDKYLSWNTDKLFVPIISEEGFRSSKYILNGFEALQIAIDMAFIDLSNPNKKIEFSIQEFPDPPHAEDAGLSQLFMYFLPLITIFSFIFLCPAVLQRVGEEKHSGTKEFMKMIGMDSSLIWLGWFIHALITNLFSIIAVVILMKVPFWGVSYPPIEYSNGVVLFMFLFLYCMAAVTFCFLIATIINRPSIATVVGLLVWIFSYFIPQGLVTTYENLAWKWKIPLALFPNMALHYGYTSISVWEMREVGIQWYNMFQSGSGGETDVTMGNVFLMLISDMIIFMLLTIYIENIKPGEYGIPKPYSFPLVHLKNWVKNGLKNTSQIVNMSENGPLRDTEQGKTPCIEIHNLRKKFNKTIAVDNLNMDIYKNYITVLLGHNGAGKTTTMSILTGMINATSGYIKINGNDITKSTNDVRKILGLCPQHNLLFPDLTVFEHLKFFAMIKRSTSAHKDATDMLEKLGLEDKRNDMASMLSGGMKRKLCLGMALIGDSQVLILDEPTSGMDPESRRKVWNMLLEYRKSKTILITTHFMEEADVLGDYIAIMANGCLLCYDTPIHLKKKYNTGYHVSLKLKSKDFVKNITMQIKEQIPEAKLLRESDDTVVYLLPMDKKDKYRDVFVALETQKEQLGIVTIGLSLTTLNDVFFKAKDEIDGPNCYNEVDEECKEVFKLNERIKFNCCWYTRLIALIKKRWSFLKKKFYWYLPAFIISITIFLLGIWLGISNTDYNPNGEPQLNLTLKVYDKSYVYYGGDSLELRKIYSEMVAREGGHPVFHQDVSEGIIQEGIKNIAFYKRHMAVAAEFNETSPNEIVINAMYNHHALHAVPISVNLALNAAVKAILNGSYSISTNNKPLKPANSEFSPTELSPVGVLSVWIILIPLSMLFFISNYIIFPNSEVSTNFLQVQTLAGVKTPFYWLTNVVFDFLFSLPQLAVMFLLLVFLNCLAYHNVMFQEREFGALVAIIVTYVFVSFPFAYVLSHKKTITGGFSLLLILGIVIGFTPTMVVIPMEFSGDEYYMKIAKIIKHLFILLSPHFSLNYMCVKFTKKFVDNFNWKFMDVNKRGHICRQEPNPCCYGVSNECMTYQSYFNNKELGILNDLLEMFACFVFYYVMLLVLNTEALQKVLHYVKYIPSYVTFLKKKKPDIDEIDSPSTPFNKDDNKNTLIVDKLTKTYGTETVVKNLALHLERNKCFGLLGVNGAGKSTTFRMLTKSLFFDKGIVELKGRNRENIAVTSDDYTKKIGYCPQEDYLNFFLTGEELLYTMAVLKGYPDPEARKVTEHLLKCFGLHKYKDKICMEYSGGNKRKLGTCMAFLGCPEVILLDEPTSGVDPSSRRDFWKIFNAFKKQQKTSFLLCSHSMEECENLCDEIAIMKRGTIKAKGSLLDLRNQYSKGYKVTIKLKNGSDGNLVEEVFSRRLDADLKEAYAESLEYQVKDGSKTLSELFTRLEDLKREFDCIDDYIVNQISLEDIFLSVADGK